MTFDESAKDFPTTVRVAGIKIRNCGELKKVGVGDVHLQVGDQVILDLDNDLTYGVVHSVPQQFPFAPPMRVMKTIVRKATAEDLRLIMRAEQQSKEGWAYCRERTAALGIVLKLVEVCTSIQRRAMRFTYTAPERVDFRQLVKDLARRFGGRIEMQQIGEREEAKRLGGVDSCGLVVCCAAFLTEFKPITVKQAKVQGLQVDDDRLIGICGRLKCCLMFESDEGSRPSSLSRRTDLILPTSSHNVPGRIPS